MRRPFNLLLCILFWILQISAFVVYITLPNENIVKSFYQRFVLDFYAYVKKSFGNAEIMIYNYYNLPWNSIYDDLCCF